MACHVPTASGRFYCLTKHYFSSQPKTTSNASHEYTWTQLDAEEKGGIGNIHSPGNRVCARGSFWKNSSRRAQRNENRDVARHWRAYVVIVDLSAPMRAVSENRSDRNMVTVSSLRSSHHHLPSRSLIGFIALESGAIPQVAERSSRVTSPRLWTCNLDCGSTKKRHSP